MAAAGATLALALTGCTGGGDTEDGSADGAAEGASGRSTSAAFSGGGQPSPEASVEEPSGSPDADRGGSADGAGTPSAPGEEVTPSAPGGGTPSAQEDVAPSDEGDEGTPSEEATDPDLPYSATQQMGAPQADRRAVQERLDGLMGRYAAEMTSVLPSVEPPGTEVIDRRAWALGSTGHVVCSGQGSLTWASGPPDRMADDHTLPCTSDWGVPAVEAPRGPRADPNAVRGLPARLHQQLALAPDEGTQAWVGTHVPLAQDEPNPQLSEQRAEVLEALGEAPTTAADRGVVEFDGQSEESAEPVVATFQAQAGSVYLIEAHCRGTGEVDLTVIVSTYMEFTEKVPCDGDARAIFTAYATVPMRELHLEPEEGTRAVVSFQVAHQE